MHMLEQSIMSDRVEGRMTLRTRVLEELVRASEDGHGLTDCELSLILKANKNHVPCRRRDVELNGFCQKTTYYRKTNTGVSAVVHMVTQSGVDFYRTGQPVPPRPRNAAPTILPRTEVTRMYRVNVKLRHEGRDLARVFQTMAALKPDGRIVFKFDDMAYYVKRGDEFTIQPV